MVVRAYLESSNRCSTKVCGSVVVSVRNDADSRDILDEAIKEVARKSPALATRKDRELWVLKNWRAV